METITVHYHCSTVRCLHLHFLGTRRLELNGVTWHDACFICQSCKKPIGSQGFVPHKGQYFCVACHENKMSPRCKHCKQVRRSTSQGPVEGITGVETSTGLVIEQIPAWQCPCPEQCISWQALPEGGIIYQGVFWHRKCLLCASCRSPLADQSFTSHQDQPHCLSCYNRLYANKCEACGEPITGKCPSQKCTWR